jgi:AraC-like DNA-binding protein
MTPYFTHIQTRQKYLARIMITNNLLFFFSALGAFNGFVLVGLLLFKPQRNVTDYLLAGVVLMLSIRVVKSVFYYFNPDLPLYFLQIGLSACLLIGPFLMSYVVVSLLNQKKTPPKQIPRLLRYWQWHLGWWVGLVLSLGALFPYETHPDYWTAAFNYIYQIWMLYIVLTGYLLYQYFSLAVIKELSSQDEQFWLLNVYGGNFLVWVAYYTTSYTSYIVGALSFSVILYWLFLTLYLRRQSNKTNKPKVAYPNKLSREEVSRLEVGIVQLMTTEKLFQNANLTLPETAKHLRVSPQKLSQFLNDNIGMPFNHFVNEYRIKEAQRQLKSSKKVNIESLSEDVGFNSASTFYSAFKKVTNTTPAKYKIQVTNSLDL